MKKIVKILTIFCFVITSLIFVSCSGKASEIAEGFSFSIRIVDGVGKIDESSLTKEYDIEQNRDIEWTKIGSDYQISVKRASAFSGVARIKLLEGLDYSNVEFTVNGVEKDFSIKNNTSNNCATMAHLTDRVFEYNFSEIDSTTEFVVDFSDCELAKVTLDVSELQAGSVKYMVVEDDFVTLQEASALTTNTLSQSSLVLDYNTVIAFDSPKRIEFQIGTETNVLNYASYGAKYLIKENKIQYLVAKNDGEFSFYSEPVNTENNGKVKVLAYSGIDFASSLADMNNENYITNYNYSSDVYDDEVISSIIFGGSTLYCRLSNSAFLFDYYLLDQIDEECTSSNKVPYTIDGGVKYLAISLNSEDSVKYLVRISQFPEEFYGVCVDSLPAGTSVIDYDYITIGNDNKRNDVPDYMTDKVFYFYRNAQSTKIKASPATIDPVTNREQENRRVFFVVKNWNYESQTSVNALNSSMDLAGEYAVKELTYYNAMYSNQIYSARIDYEITPFTNMAINIDATDLLAELSDGEEIFVTSGNPYSNWQLLTNETNLSISSANSGIVFFYIKGTNALNLRLLNGDAQVVSSLGILRDCFGRSLSGTVTVAGETIALKDVLFMELLSGYFENYTATLVG